LKNIVFIISALILGLLGTLIFLSYQNYVNPKHIYGTWVEFNVLASRQDILVFGDNGVSRNDHLITTRFKYDGKTITFTTGEGKTVYRIAGTKNIPQLKRMQPKSPPQILIRQEDEKKIESEKATTLRPKVSLSDSSF